MNRAPKLALSLLLMTVSPALSQAGRGLTQSCPAPQFPGTPTAIDSTCGIQGSGRGADGVQDAFKNNFCAPGPPQAITFDQLRNLQAAVQQNKAINFGNPSEHPISNLPGATTNRAPLGVLGEGRLRVLEGFILIARQEGAESVNCGKPPSGPPNVAVSHDIHISLVPDVEAIHGPECDSVVVEMSPHHRPAQWTRDNVLFVASKHARVRATGQLFFDSSHSPCENGSAISGDPSRMSLWEIHPIYKFEVCSETDCTKPQNWLSLEAWLVKHPNTNPHLHH